MSEINENNAYLCVVCRVCPLPAARYRYGRYVCLPTYPVLCWVCFSKLRHIKLQPESHFNFDLQTKLIFFIY